MVEVRFHVRFACKQRVVPCRFDFCGASFPITLREQHERSECQNMYARNKVLSQVSASINDRAVACLPHYIINYNPQNVLGGASSNTVSLHPVFRKHRGEGHGRSPAQRGIIVMKQATMIPTSPFTSFLMFIHSFVVGCLFVPPSTV